MKIGITGENGFIGGEVAGALSREGIQVVPLGKHIRPCTWDALNLTECPNDLTWILHFAADTSIPASFSDPMYTYYNNLISTLLALKIAQNSKSAFLFMSSYVYGHPQYLPIDEKHPLSSLNPYMGSKIMGEEISQQLCREASLPLVILRASTIYGNCSIPGRLISDLLESLRKGQTVTLNDPLPKRDYLYIKDFCVLIRKILASAPVKTGVYNVGAGRSYSNREVAETACRLAHAKCAIEVKSRPRHNDVTDCSLDVSLVKNTFSWAPRYSLEMGLSELIELNVQHIADRQL